MNIIHRIPRLVEPILDNRAELVSGGLTLVGTWEIEQFRKGKMVGEKEIGTNCFMTEGMARLCNIIFGATTKAGSTGLCFMGLIGKSIVPVPGDTAAKLGASGNAHGELLVDYTPATNRPTYTIAATSTAGCTNAAAKAEFTIITAPVTVYGAFLSMVAAKSDVSGPLVCAKAFGTARTTEIADVLSIAYAITMS